MDRHERKAKVEAVVSQLRREPAYNHPEMKLMATGKLTNEDRGEDTST
jgi:hypothetical protein